jgi:trehalose synthase
VLRTRRCIPNQIIHKLTGVRVHSVEGCAFQIRYLLTHPEFARTIDGNGREHVKENFLMTTNVKRWLLLFRILEQRKGRRPKAA